MSNRLFDREPDQITRGDRRITFDWLVGESPGGRAADGAKRHFVSYTLSYTLGGPNYFSGGMTPRGFRAGLTYEAEERGAVFTSRSFTIGQGLGGIFHEAQARYSAKRFEAAIPKALERLREVADDPRIQQIVQDARDGAARAQEQAA